MSTFFPTQADVQREQARFITKVFGWMSVALAVTGAMAMYAVFFDTKATPVLNDYVGGSNPGDTTVSIKNAFGAGPVLGFKMNLNDTWHLSLNVGHVKLKTTATIIRMAVRTPGITPAANSLPMWVSVMMP